MCPEVDRAAHTVEESGQVLCLTLTSDQLASLDGGHLSRAFLVALPNSAFRNFATLAILIAVEFGSIEEKS
jgi:hypothetical protein